MLFIDKIVSYIRGKMNATLADYDERIDWWNDEKSRCEEELVNARMRGDHDSAKAWEREAGFCKERIAYLHKCQREDLYKK